MNSANTRQHLISLACHESARAGHHGEMMRKLKGRQMPAIEGWHCDKWRTALRLMNRYEHAVIYLNKRIQRSAQLLDRSNGG